MNTDNHIRRGATSSCENLLNPLEGLLLDFKLERDYVMSECEKIGGHGGGTISLFDTVRCFCEELILAPKDSSGAQILDQVRNYFLLKTESGQDRPINVGNLFHVHSKKDEIRAYFEEQLTILTQMPPEEAPTRGFLRSIKIDDCYVAPLHLLSGLMSTFKEEWDPVLKHFGKTMQRCTPNETDFQQVKLFNYDCWLLWGPSIPFCDCDQWLVGGQPGAALQAGFGDENNSFPLVNLTNAPKFNDLRKDVLRHRETSPAKRSVLTVRPLPSVNAKNVLPPSQAGLSEEDENGKPALGTIGIVLDYVAHKPFSASRRDQYYSAYVWMMFAVLKDEEMLVPIADANGEPDFSRAWEGLLPIFIHGNLADKETYFISKVQLVYKALGTIAALKCLVGGGGHSFPMTDVKLAYVCASDDPGGCSADRQSSDNESIWELMDEALKADGGPFRSLKAGEVIRHHGKIKRGDWPDKKFLSACWLPRIVKAFYDNVRVLDK